jgi:hypothetical protein
VILFAGLLALTFVASRSCADRGELSKEQAIEIARREVDFAPDGENIRFLRRGFNQRPLWAVSLWQRGAGGVDYRRITVVVVDADTGEVTEVRRER